MAEPKLRWGIIGAGNIARKLADAVLLDDSSELVAVASKALERSTPFAESYNIDACADYQALVARDDVDVVYVATTHNFHYENALLALKHDKHVLVEKPFTVNAKEAQALVDVAAERGLFLMEAIWVRNLPSMVGLKQLLKDGIIGEIKLFNISFGGFASPAYIQRLTRPELAGGVTLDMGIYPITFINFLLDELPEVSRSLCRFSDTGVDELATYMFKYPGGCMANVNTSFNLLTKSEAMIYGANGFIEFPAFQQGRSFTVHIHNGTRDIISTETVSTDNHENGFIYQVAEVAKQIRAGKLQSDIIPLEETVATMKLMDSMRHEWGLRYPFEI